MVLCHLAALNAWDEVEGSGKRTELFTKIIRGPAEAFSDVLQILTSVVNRIVSDLGDREMLVAIFGF